MASITNVINISLAAEGQAAQADNPNVVAVITFEQDGPLSTAERYRSYTQLADVATDWGTSHEVYQAATAFFGTAPNPVNAGGRFVVGYWRASSETVAELAGYVTGGVIDDPDALLATLQGIDDGSLSGTVDGGSAQDITGLDFSAVTSLTAAAAIIDAAISGADFEWDDTNSRFTSTSATTGATSVVTLFTPGSTGTGLQNLLKVGHGTGAVATAGAALDSIDAELQEAAATALIAEIAVKGITFLAPIVSVPLMGAWAEANRVLVYEVFSDSAVLTPGSDSAPWVNKLAGRTHFRCIYSPSGAKALAVSYMARAHTTVFSGENTASTMNLKHLAATPDDLSQTVIDQAHVVGCDVYVTIKDVSVVLCSGANDFVDNVYNVDAFVSQLEVDLFNALGTSPTKIPQTQAGVDTLLDTMGKTCRQYVRAGVFAPGTWTSSTYFGDRDAFVRGIAEDGYVVGAGDLADQSTADRQARKSPTLQAAVKNAGAIHSADVIVNFNL